MKLTPIFILSILISSCVTSENNLITVPLLFPNQFNKSFEAEVIIVEKPNTYYSQNLVKLPFYVKVIKINGNEIKNKPVLEFSTTRNINYKLGSKQYLNVYESLQEVGRPLIDNSPKQFELHYRNILRDVKYSSDPNDPFNTNEKK